MSKIPARYASIVMPFLLSILMTCIVSMISTFNGLAPDQDFIELWLASWCLSWVVAFPTLILVLPFVKKLTSILVETE